jgi:hypothetical protein
MINCCSNSFDFDTFQKTLTLILGILTLIILIAGYYKFLQNKLRDKQLDIVCELVKQIQQEDWQYIKFNQLKNTIPPSKRFPIATIFDIAEMEEFDKYENLYFWGMDFETSNKELQSWSFFFKFYSNPFLPKSIAKELKKFNTWQVTQTIDYDEVKKKDYILVGRKKQISPGAYCFYYTEGEMTTCKDFKKACINLKFAIINWAQQYGLDDLNITTSHIHRKD